MGTYPDLPSFVLATGENLQDVIDKYPTELFGETVLREFGNKDLPFLPKVLSIAKALPLQLHPVHFFVTSLKCPVSHTELEQISCSKTTRP